MAIFLILLHVATATEMHQLFRMPALMHHFADHNHGGVKMGLAKFLDLHYLHNHAQPGEDQHHDHLPFSCHDDMCLSHTTVFAPLVIQMPPLIVPGTSLYNVIPDEKSLPSHLPESVWQPPRLG